MRYLFIFVFLYFLSIHPIINSNFLAAKNSSSIQDEFYEHEWLKNYFSSSFRGDFCIEKALDFLFSIKENLVLKGGDVPDLSEMLLSIQTYVKRMDPLFDETHFDFIYKLLKEREIEHQFNYHNSNFSHEHADILLIKNKKEKPSSTKENKEISGGIILGLCKILAGGLCCVIPYPVAQVAGAALITDGLADLGVECKELDEKNLKYQEEHGPPPPPPRFPPDFFDKKDK